MVEYGLSLPVDGGTVAGVSFGWCDEPDPGVVVLVVVPVEKLLTVRCGVVEGVEVAGPVGTVFQGFEPGFGMGVVVRHPWSR